MTRMMTTEPGEQLPGSLEPERTDTMENFTKRDWIMVRDALRWFSDNQEQAAITTPEDVRELSASFNTWRRRLADEIESKHITTDNLQ